MMYGRLRREERRSGRRGTIDRRRPRRVRRCFTDYALNTNKRELLRQERQNVIDRREMGEWGNAASTTVFFLLPVLCIRGEKTSTCCVLCWLFLVRQGERRAPVVRCAVCGGGWHTICRNRHTDVTAHRCNRHTNRSRLHVTLGRSALAVACGRGGAGGGGARTERARPRRSRHLARPRKRQARR